MSVTIGGLGAAGGYFTLTGPDAEPLAAAPAAMSDPNGSGGGLPGDPEPAPTTSKPTAASSSTTSTPPPVTSTTPPAPTTTPPVSTSSTPTSTSSRTAAADGSPAGQVLALVNAERRTAGCDPVTADPRLADSAQGHSEDMAEQDYFSHTSQDGRSFGERILAAGFPSPGAENIAVGASSAEKVMDMWMKSPGHRKNILNCELRKLGTGVATDGWYWTQNFGR